MAVQQERILVVESDPIISDLIARQALEPQGFLVKVVADANSAIREAAAFSPDAVIANLELPGLSGKDLMAALSSQSTQIPIVMIAPQGKEKDVIQAFRLGASDYIGAPVREAEVVSAVERALKTVRARRERERLSRQLEQANQELQKRVRDLTTIFSVGKAVTSITDQRALFDKILDAAISMTESDVGWLLIQDERSGDYLLQAHRDLPKSLSANMNHPLEDGISSLVAASGESLILRGEPLSRLKIAPLGKAALATPIKAKNRTIGVLVMLRKDDKAFSTSDQAMLEAVSDYASISLVNARLFRAVDQRANVLQSAVERSKGTEKVKDEIIQTVSHELRTPLASAKGYIDMLVSGDMGKLASSQQEALETSQQKLQRVVEVIDAMAMMNETAAPKQQVNLNLNDLTKNAAERFRQFAKQGKVNLRSEMPNEAIVGYGDPEQIALVLDALLSNAIKFSPNGGPVTLALERAADGTAHVSVQDNGIGIGKKNINLIFNRFYQIDGTTARKYSGLGIGLAMAREIIVSHGGRIWVESKQDAGSTFHFTLPPPP